MLTGILVLAALFQAEASAVIEGTALDRVTHSGVPGVTVNLASPSSPHTPLFTATTSATGQFQFTHVKDGDYVTSFQTPPGYLAPPCPAPNPEYSDPSCKPFHVSTGNLPKIEVSLMPEGKISGRVLDIDGHPMPRVRVEFFSPHRGSGATTTTDTQGRFSSGYLQPGSYQLRARPVLAGSLLEQHLKMKSPVPDSPLEEKSWAWVPTYFPNAVDIEAADTVVVHEGVDLTGYDIHLRSEPVYRLCGLVSDAEGQPVDGAELWLGSKIGWGPAEGHAVSSQDGSFELPSVTSGKWEITAVAHHKKGHDWKGFAEVVVPNHEIDDVKISIVPPFTLEVLIAGLPPRKGSRAQVGVFFESVNGGEGSGMERPDGTLHIESVYPGNYRVGEWMTLPGYYLASILLGSEDATGKDVYIRSNQIPLHLIFKSPAARVRGSVENGAGVRAILVEADAEHQIPAQSIRGAICDKDGHFDIEGLRPGAYYAFASRTWDGSSGILTEAIFSGELRDQAETIHLSEGETATLNLRVISWPY